MAIITVTSTINYAYLMNKSKSDLAYMYLDLLELRVKDESALAALKEQADQLAEALEEAREHIKLYVSLRNLPRHAQNPGSKPLILVDIDAALADWRTARQNS